METRLFAELKTLPILNYNGNEFEIKFRKACTELEYK